MGILDLINLNKSFGENNCFEILKDINLSAKKGEFICILGPSGCGKTILLYLIAGFLNPTSGKILVEEKQVEKPDTDRVMVFQDYVLFPWKTVYENILFGIKKLDIDDKTKNDMVMHYLELIELVEFKDWYPHKLSGGMQQRVALARALIINPKILLMDEPLSALDPHNRQHLRKKIEEIWEKTKKTIIFVTHDISEAIHLADKIYLLTAKPAKIKKVYDINLSRPRHSTKEEFMQIEKKIKKEMKEEFEKSTKYELNKKELDYLMSMEENIK